jgi:hypothetical protein
MDGEELAHRIVISADPVAEHDTDERLPRIPRMTPRCILCVVASPCEQALARFG